MAKFQVDVSGKRSHSVKNNGTALIDTGASYIIAPLKSSEAVYASIKKVPTNVEALNTHYYWPCEGAQPTLPKDVKLSIIVTRKSYPFASSDLLPRWGTAQAFGLTNAFNVSGSSKWCHGAVAGNNRLPG